MYSLSDDASYATSVFVVAVMESKSDFEQFSCRRSPFRWKGAGRFEVLVRVYDFSATPSAPVATGLGPDSTMAC